MLFLGISVWLIFAVLKDQLCFHFFLVKAFFHCRFSYLFTEVTLWRTKKLSKAVAMLCEKYEQLGTLPKRSDFYSKRSLLYKAEAGTVDKGA